jgi:uncharacterized protein YbaR (Trm112 family)
MGIEVTCPSCKSRLEVTETHSGGRTVAVVAAGAQAKEGATGREHFHPPGNGHLVCPACDLLITPRAF